MTDNEWDCFTFHEMLKVLGKKNAVISQVYPSTLLRTTPVGTDLLTPSAFLHLHSGQATTPLSRGDCRQTSSAHLILFGVSENSFPKHQIYYVQLR